MNESSLLIGSLLGVLLMMAGLVYLMIRNQLVCKFLRNLNDEIYTATCKRLDQLDPHKDTFDKDLAIVVAKNNRSDVLYEKVSYDSVLWSLKPLKVESYWTAKEIHEMVGRINE